MSRFLIKIHTPRVRGKGRAVNLYYVLLFLHSFHICLITIIAQSLCCRGSTRTRTLTSIQLIKYVYMIYIDLHPGPSFPTTHSSLIIRQNTTIQREDVSLYKNFPALLLLFKFPSYHSHIT